jgi:hypothetical protein
MTAAGPGTQERPAVPGPGCPSESCPQFRCDRPRETGDHATIPTTSRPNEQERDRSMYTLTSTAGLNTSVPTIAQAAAALAQHLHDLTPDGPVHWSITTPFGTTHTGHLRLNGLPDHGFLADTITEITDNLRSDAEQKHLAG